MKDLGGKVVLLTGASGGLGCPIALALAEQGMHLVLCAYPGEDLEKVKATTGALGARTLMMVTDVRDGLQCRRLVEQAREEFGRIDVLINNAGVEHTAAYHDLEVEEILDIVNVNLGGAMRMTRLVLPGMLERGCGHIVNMASLAGKAGPAFQEPYAASKAGLIAFTASLRATYRGTGVSASVICPGFVEAGIYANLKAATGFSAPPLLGTSPPGAVVRAVLRAITHDLPEVIVNPLPVKPLFATALLCPRLGEFLIRQTGAHRFFRRVAEALKRKAASR
jgi:NAD(P)-dependent dehydrogenase (short-subunit alcohol dehydrogenase family)